MITTLRTLARVILTPVHLKRTLLIAFVVGGWLNLFNHGDELLLGVMNAHLAAKLALNYLTPSSSRMRVWWRTDDSDLWECDGFVLRSGGRRRVGESLGGVSIGAPKNHPRNRFRG